MVKKSTTVAEFGKLNLESLVGRCDHWRHDIESQQVLSGALARYPMRMMHGVVDNVLDV